MVLDGALRNSERGANLAVRVPACEKPQHPDLAIGQLAVHRIARGLALRQQAAQDAVGYRISASGSAPSCTVASKIIKGGSWSGFSEQYPDNPPRQVQFSVSGSKFWLARFGLRPLAAGVLGEGATGALYAGYGPGLAIGGDGRGCNTVAGRFQVQEAAYDSGGNVLRFTATFEQSCENRLPLLRGCLHYEQP